MNSWTWVKGPFARDPEVARELRDGRGRVRATVWSNGTWHSWDEDGVGGENDCCTTLIDAMDQAVAAVVRQGWSPFKIKYA